MPSRIRNITIDSHAPLELAAFWSDVLGFAEDPDFPNLPDDPEALIVDPTGRQPGLLFVPVPEAKTVKNRVHFDLQPDDTRDATVDRLTGVGAALVDDRRLSDGRGWVVLADPEGNEFCVERSAAERGQTSATVSTGDRWSPDEIRTAGEREILVRMLDHFREGVRNKVNEISPVHAAARLVPSDTTVAGVVKHLAVVEDSWFTNLFIGEPMPEPWASAPWQQDRDWEWHTAPGEPIADSVALYEAAIERSRRATADHELDDRAAIDDDGQPFTLRWLLVHMLEETARHLGQLDILREQLDGRVGE